MIRYLFVLSVLLGCVSANTSSLTGANMQWLDQHHEQLVTTLSSSENTDFIPSLNTLLALWEHRDGAITGEVSPYIIQSIVAAPELVLGALESHPGSYSRWLEQLQGQVFTAIEPEQMERLNRLKLDLESALTRYITQPDSQKVESANRLLEQVQAITVRVVD